MIKQKLKNLIPHDCFFYITNPERSKDFNYKKKSPDEINKNRSGVIQRDNGYEDASLDEIKSIAAARNGMLFINSLILSGLFTGVLFIAGIIINPHWSAYAACSVIYPSAAYLIYNILNIRFYGIYLIYKIEGGKLTFYNMLLDSLYELSGADNVWHINRVSPNKKMNSHGGAKEIYDRSIVKIKKQLPGFIKTGVNVRSVELTNARLFFFPDFILLEKKRKFSFIMYESLSVEYIEKPYYETSSDPDDGEKIGKTWLHPKKGGSADRRYRDNPEISIMLYAEVKISSSSSSSSAGHSFYFQVSNRRSAYMFYKFLSMLSVKHSEEKYRKPAQPKRKRKDQKTNHQDESRSSGNRSDNRPAPEEDIEKAYSVLGLKAGASPDEIRAAYYVMAKKYHPDMITVKRRFPESDEKMKEINKAYERLKG